jgi:hypothetical protein
MACTRIHQNSATTKCYKLALESDDGFAKESMQFTHHSSASHLLKSRSHPKEYLEFGTGVGLAQAVVCLLR